MYQEKLRGMRSSRTNSVFPFQESNVVFQPMYKLQVRLETATSSSTVRLIKPRLGCPEAFPLLWEMESWERPEQCITPAAPDTVLPSPCRSGSETSTRSSQDTRNKAVGKGGGKVQERNQQKQEEGSSFCASSARDKTIYLPTETKRWLRKRGELEAHAENRDT